MLLLKTALRVFFTKHNGMFFCFFSFLPSSNFYYKASMKVNIK
ncbi:hypothetical protein BN1184_AD_01730 [Pantoea ananatis]|nr:hypothetical protein BN1184_AD_01730 [Pantoea ananatis]